MDALAKGEVQPAGINLNYVLIHHPRDIYDRMLGGHEFDASEMSLSEYICRYAAGERDLVAIPVFPSRVFRHNCIAINTNIVKEPSDLNGKRIGVQLYTMTAAVWIRGLLQDAGVELSTITWVEGALEKPGVHGNVKAKPLLRPINLETNTNPNKSISQLLEDDELAATIGAEPPTCIGSVPHIQCLFPDPLAAEQEYYKKTGVFPIMHTVVIKKDIVDKYPFVPSSLYHALNESKDKALRKLKVAGAPRYAIPFLPSYLDQVEKLFGGDLWPYGVEPNRKTLEAAVSFLYEQGMVDREIPLEELFAPVRGQNLKIGL